MQKKQKVTYSIIGLAVVALVVAASTNLPGKFLLGDAGEGMGSAVGDAGEGAILGDVKEVCQCDCFNIDSDPIYTDSKCTDRDWNYTPNGQDCSTFDLKVCNGYYINHLGECKATAKNTGWTKHCLLVTVPVEASQSAE